MPEATVNPSICGLRMGIAVRGPLQDLRGRTDLGFGWLHDGVPGRSGPGRERLAQVSVAGILGRDSQALPFGECVGERLVGDDEIYNPLAHFRDRVFDGQSELVALSLGSGLGFG